MPLRFFATARSNGATLLNYIEVTGLLVHDGVVSGAAVHDHVTGRDAEIHADLTVNATGPWSERVASHGRCRRSDPPLARRHARAARTHVQHGDQPPASRRATATSWCRSARCPSSGPARGSVEDPDDLGVPEDHVARHGDGGVEADPCGRDATHRAAWSAARPLIGSRGDADSGRELSRTFKTIDHAAEGGAEGFVTITGGKAHHAPRDGGGLRRRRLPQARRRRAVPHAGDGAAPPRRLLRRVMVVLEPGPGGATEPPDRPAWAHRTFRVFRFDARRRTVAVRPVRGRGGTREHGAGRASDGSRSTAIRRSPSGTPASTPRAAPAASA